MRTLARSVAPRQCGIIDVGSLVCMWNATPVRPVLALVAAFVCPATDSRFEVPLCHHVPLPGGGWKEGETIIALYAYRLRGGHWRIDCCVKGRAALPQGQLRRLAALALTGVWRWGDRAEEHNSYACLQMFTRANREQRKHLREVR